MDLSRTKYVINRGLSEQLHTGAQVCVMRVGSGDQVLAEFSVGNIKSGQWSAWLSAGKPITAAAVISLWEKEMLKLHDPVSKFLPGFRGGGKEKITLWHCLTHTAGLRVGGMDNGGMGWWSRPVGEILGQVFQSEIEPGWEVGQSAGYHIGSTWFLLGAVIEAALGKTAGGVGAAVRELILDPAGMKESSLGLGDGGYEAKRSAGELALMHDTLASSAAAARGEPGIAQTKLSTWETASSFDVGRPPAGMRGTAGDLARFYALLGNTDGCSFLGAPAALAMTSRQRVGKMDKTFKCIVDWGLGVICNSAMYATAADAGKPIAYGFGPYAGERAFGHGGNMSSMGWADAEKGIAGAVMFDGQPGEPRHQKRMHETIGAIYEDLGLA